MQAGGTYVPTLPIPLGFVCLCLKAIFFNVLKSTTIYSSVSTKVSPIHFHTASQGDEFKFFFKKMILNKTKEIHT